MEIGDQLKNFGLSKSESAVYLYLLEHGLSSPPQISKGTTIAVTNCYHILQSLKELNLIAEQSKGKRKAYLPQDPDALVHMAELKKKAAEGLANDLRGIFSLQKNKPKIKYYEGLEQVKKIYLETLSAKKIYGLGSTKMLSDLAPELYNYYLKQLKNKDIVFHDILTAASRAKGAPEMKDALKVLYDAKFLPNEYGDQPTDMLIWDDNIALITLEEPIFGTVITSPLIAKTFGIMFDVMWKNLQ